MCVAMVLLLPISGFAAKAQSIESKVMLTSVKQIKKTERHGDELYLSVTSFPTKGKAKHKRFPHHPLFWPGRHIAKVKDVKIWKGKLKKDAGVRLLISLVEQDSPPWDIDDEIGSVDLKLHNNNGKLEIEWNRPNRSDGKKLTVKSVGEDISINFSGKGQSYEVSLKIVG